MKEIAGTSPAMTTIHRSRVRLATSPVREVPVKVARLAVERPGLERPVVDAGDRRHFGKIARRENLVGGLEIRIGEGFLDHHGAGLLQQPGHALTRDAVEERAIRCRSEAAAVL